MTQSKREIERARCREKYHRLYKGKKRDYSKSKTAYEKYKKSYPEKYQAGMAIRNWPRKKGFHYHHWSYNEEHYLDVITISTADHYLLHRHIVYDNSIKLYRTTGGDILLTKKSHIKLLAKLK